MPRKPYLFAAGGRPAPGTPMNLSHPLASGLATAYLFNEGWGSLRVEEQTRLGYGGNGSIEFPNLDTLHGLSGEGYFNRNGGLSRRVIVTDGGGLDDTSRGAIVMVVRWEGDQSAGGTPVGGIYQRDDSSAKWITLDDPDPDLGVVEWRWTTPAAADITGTTPVGDGRWRLVIASFKDGNHELYLDGKLEGTAAATGSTDATAPIYVPVTFAGTVALLMEFRRSLSTDEIQQLAGDPYLLWRPRGGPSWTYVSTLTIAGVERGKSTLTNAIGVTDRGLASRGLDRFSLLDSGEFHVLAGGPFAGADRGTSATLNTVTGADRGDARYGLDPFAGSERGTSAALNTVVGTDRGEARLALDAFAGTDRGTGAVWMAFALTDRGTSAVHVQIAAADRGKHRLANDALERYELYRGVDEEPDFTGSPWQTFTSLPYTTPALTGYPATYYFTVRRRNKFGLLSQNVASWSIELNASGAAVVPPPSAPINVAAQAVGVNNVRVTAQYNYRADGPARAGDTWLVYVRTNGTDPDPSTDTPVDTPTIVKRDGTAILSYDHSGSFPVRAVVRVRRSGTPNVDSASSAVVTAIPLPVTADEVTRPEALLGHGDQQQQDSSIT